MWRIHKYEITMKLFRKIIFHHLKHIKKGQLWLIEGDTTHRFGNPQDNPLKIIINNSKTYQMICLNGILGAGTAYVQHYWHTENLAAVINIILKNQAVFRGMDGLASRIKYFFDSLVYRLRKNNIIRAKQYIEAHYDLSNDFFRLFLDDHMMYSCAVFDEQHTTLQQASTNKLQRICDKLALKSSDHILEIGTGWGGFAVFAAKHFGCQITTTTISKKQFKHVQELIKQQGLTDKITVLYRDYRHLSGEYDKIVSIEMIEAVGYQYFKDYFQKIDSLLKPGGRVFIQAITINDKDYHRAKYEVDFIKKYIFPGGCLPSLAQIRHHISTDTVLMEAHMEDIGRDYAKTLQLWAERFDSQKTAVKALGFSDEFIKKWTFYFAYCQAGFMSKHISNVQGLWIKN